MGDDFYVGTQTELQQAINYTSQTPGHDNIYLEDGAYIRLYNEVQIWSENDITIRTEPGYDDIAIVDVYLVYNTGFCLKYSDNIDIEYIKFINNDPNANTKAIRLYDCEYVDIMYNEFEDNKGEDWGNSAIELYRHTSGSYGNRYIEIRHNYIYDFDNGIWVTSCRNGTWGHHDFTNNDIITHKHTIKWDQLGGNQKPRYWNNWCYWADEAAYAKGDVDFSTNGDNFYIWDQSDTYVLTSDGSSCLLYHSNNYYEWCYDRLKPRNSGTLSYLGGDSWRQCPDR